VIAAVGIESTLYIIRLSAGGDNVPSIESFSNGLMKVWYVRISPDRQHFLSRIIYNLIVLQPEKNDNDSKNFYLYISVNYTGYVELLDKSGEVVRSVLADKVKQTTTLAYVINKNKHTYLNYFF
jgi:undecaprenyl pyrophosphate synthase